MVGLRHNATMSHFHHDLACTYRLFERELEYIVNHAKDDYIMLDVTFVDLVVKMQDRFPTVKGFIILTDKQHMPKHNKLRNMLCYEDLLQVGCCQSAVMVLL